MPTKTNSISAVQAIERAFAEGESRAQHANTNALFEVTPDDPALNIRSHGSINWFMDGQVANRQIDRIGIFDKDFLEYPGYASAPCGAKNDNQPYQAIFAFNHELSATPTEFWDRWALLEPPYTAYLSKFRVRELLLREGMYLASGQRCTGPVLQTHGDFLLVTSLNIRRREKVRCVFFFQSRGSLWEGQSGRLGALMLQVFNGTNNQLVYSQDVTDWLSSKDVNFKLVLTDVIGDTVRDNFDDFRLDLSHTCHDKATNLGITQGAGAVIQFALANEFSRESA